MTDIDKVYHINSDKVLPRLKQFTTFASALASWMLKSM